jgi:hypothetical protein
MSSSAKSKTLEIGTLFGVAVEAAREIKAPPRTGGERPALISVVFSAIALESFLNEITEHARQLSEHQPTIQGHPEIVLFAQVMGDAEDAHARLESKFTFANWILSGRSINWGSQPYQDFALLMRLRNDLVHTKTNKLFDYGTMTNEEGHRELMSRFRNKDILADSMPTGSWTYLIQTKAVAEWACRTAASVVFDLCSSALESGFQKDLIFFRRIFESYLTTL